MKQGERNVHSYTALFEPAEEGGFVVYVPALPGCATQGETFEEAYRNTKDAIEGYLEAARALEEDIPLEPHGTIVARVPAG